MNTRAVIFDMDGVICHTNPTHSEAFRTFFAKRNIHPSDEEFAQHMFGKSNSYILSHFFNRNIEGQELLDLEFEKESLFRELYAPKIKCINGFLVFLNYLKQENFKTGVATSAPKANLDLIINGLGIEDLFESKLASEDVLNHKPNPEVYQKSALNLGVSIANCIVFEDSYSGIMAAKNAEMKVVGVLSSHKKVELPVCDYYIEDYQMSNDLLNFLK